MTDWSIAALAAAIRARRISPVEAARDCLARVERLDERLRAFITVDADGALARARVLEAEAAAGRWRGPLHGVPLAHKGSLSHRRPADFLRHQDRRVLLRRAGRHRGGLGWSKRARAPSASSTWRSWRSALRGQRAPRRRAEPWRAGHVSGGSSSGSGVAVAAGLALGALGTDTGGSIRLPAACCGIVGLKPTYGRVSRAGAMPLSWAMDHIGPMARTVSDVALMLEVIAGPDPADATSSPREVPGYLAELERSVARLRVAVPENYYLDGVDPRSRGGHASALAAFEGLGARVTSLRLPDPQVIHDVSSIIARAESAAVHSRILRERPHELQPVGAGAPRGGHPDLGATTISRRCACARSWRASSTMTCSRRPTFWWCPPFPNPPRRWPTPPRAKGRPSPRAWGGSRASRGRGTAWAAGAGVAVRLFRPRAASWASRSWGGRPTRRTVLRAGHAYERATDWHRRRPPLD